jgi:hypothetical protein
MRLLSVSMEALLTASGNIVVELHGRFEWPHEQSLFLEILLDLSDRVLSSVELLATSHVSTNRHKL